MGGLRAQFHGAAGPARTPAPSSSASAAPGPAPLAPASAACHATSARGSNTNTTRPPRAAARTGERRGLGRRQAQAPVLPSLSREARRRPGACNLKMKSKQTPRRKSLEATEPTNSPHFFFSPSRSVPGSQRRNSYFPHHQSGLSVNCCTHRIAAAPPLSYLAPNGIHQSGSKLLLALK